LFSGVRNARHEKSWFRDGALSSFRVSRVVERRNHGFAPRNSNAVTLADVGESYLQAIPAKSRGNITLARVETDLQAIATNFRGVDLICDVLPYGRLWYAEPNAISKAIGYAKFFSRSHDAVIRVYDGAGNVIETHERVVVQFKLYHYPRAHSGDAPFRRAASGQDTDCRHQTTVTPARHRIFVLAGETVSGRTNNEILRHGP
jgi:hypothetical protein